RAHAMAYASKPQEVQTMKGELWFGFEPRNVPFQVVESKDKQDQAKAEKHLARALETYEAALQLDAKNVVGRLGYAWVLDQAGQKQAAIAEYRKVIEQSWAKEGKLERAGIGFQS